ncbi:MAG: sigma-54 dependent transcriptional regulator [Flavobacteriaceae bacterium]|jgi:DNA-binding NtrC family response regulator|nr:sigma-54 dependent transcriptional regulator [Flavobacteriaceae bacterium]
MSRILIIEDEIAIRRVLTKILNEEDSNFIITEAHDGLMGVNFIKENEVDLILCDIKMPKMDGMEVLDFIKKLKPEIPIVMISGHGDLDTAVEIMRKGAFDYISKPPDLNRLLTTVRNALNNKILTTENKRLRKQINNSYEMIGDSKEIVRVKELISKVAPTNARVLITGPNGAGKELVAHWIHQKSNRLSSPLIEVNCAAIPSELIESELFGHIKGSFTGANKDKTGKFEAANHGTLFLDEIGDMSLAAQAKVLRALESNSIQKVGAQKDIKINVRVIAATNKNLLNEIKEGNFREDLYHRLAVILIDVPSLNKRKEDIPDLINYFSKKISKSQSIPLKSFNKEAVDLLKSFDWTGNVRDLRNVIERLIILGDDKIISKQNILDYSNK